MKKMLLVGVMAFGCAKKQEAAAPAPAPTAAPAPTFVPNAGANWKAAKVKVAAKNGSEEKVVDLEFEAAEPVKVTVAGVNLTLKAIQMVPDFVMSGSEVGSRSTELNNPAVQIIITEEGKEPVKQWLFEKMASVHAFEHEKITIASIGFVEKPGAGAAAPGTSPKSGE